MDAIRRHGTILMRGAALCGWACGAIMVFMPPLREPVGSVRPWGIGLLVAMTVIHCAEIPIGVKIGRKCGVAPARSAFMTAVFGFTWWLPVKRRW